MNPVSGSSTGYVRFLGAYGQGSDETHPEEELDQGDSGLESLMEDTESAELNPSHSQSREDSANVQWVIQELVSQVEKTLIEDTPMDESPRTLAFSPSQVTDLGQLKLFLRHYLVQVEKVCAGWGFEDARAVYQLCEELHTWIEEDQTSYDLNQSIRYWEELVSKIREDDSSFANGEIPPLNIGH